MRHRDPGYHVLLWNPRRLPMVALKSGAIPAIGLGSLAVGVEVVCILTAVIAGLDEPYPNMAAYVADTARAAPRLVVGAMLISGIVAFFLFALSAASRHDPQLRAFALAPLCLLVPVLVWAPARFLANVHDSSFGLLAPPPGWVMLPIWPWLGSCFWMVAGFAAYLVLTSWAFAAVLRMRPADECASCGYSLRGLPSPRCPECGTTRDVPSERPTLLFVYNADSGLFNTLSDMAHKAFSPRTYSCNLCKLTHSTFSMRDQWKAFLDGLDADPEFLHRDEFAARHPHETTPLPAVFLKRRGRLEPVADGSTIAECRSTEQLQALIRAKLDRPNGPAPAT